MTPVTWVERQGRKQLELIKELEQFRRRREPPPQPPVRKRRSRLEELLFPEGRGEEPVRDVGGTARVTAPMPQRRIPSQIEIETSQAFQEGRLPSPRRGAGFALDVLTGRRTEENPLGLDPIQFARTTPIGQIGIDVIPAVAILGVAGFQATQAGLQLMARSAIGVQLSRWLSQRNIVVPQQEQRNAADFIARQQTTKQNLNTVWQSLIRRMPAGQNPAQADMAREASKATAPLVERFAPVVIPRGTQTGALAFGGRAARKVPPIMPEKVLPPVPEVVPEEAVVPKVVPEVTPAPKVTRERQFVPRLPETERVTPLWGRTQEEILPGATASAKALGRDIEAAKRTVIQVHREAIEQALAEGKPVPTVVLADYPDLKAVTPTAPAVEQVPGEPEAVVPKAEVVGAGRETIAYGPDPNKPYQMRYRIVELDDLVPSHTDAFAPNPAYPKELQPRLRDRAANRLWVQQTAKNLSAEALVADTHMLDTGLPIVGNDLVVESGNGRILAMRLAQQTQPERWASYQKALRESLPQFGFTEEALGQMKSPVIVRERLTATDRVRFAQEANQPVVMGMSPLENALQDAGRIRLDNLYVPEETIGLDATLRLARNREFVRDFLATIQANERAVLVDTAGDLNLMGVNRLKAALFAHIYPGDAGRRLTQIFFESRDPLIRNVEDGMMASLSKVARAEEMVRSGERQSDLGIAEDLAESFDRLSRLKQAKLTVAQYLDQAQMFERHLTPFQEQLLKYLDTIARSPKAIRQFLGDYADAVVSSPNPKQITMLAMEKPTKEGILNAIIKREEEGPLFATTKAPEFIQPVRVEERVSLPETQARQVEKPAVVTPEPVEEVAPSVVAKAEAVAQPKPPPVKPQPPKTPVQRREEIKTLLAEPAKNLPKGTTKIALRKELVKINKSLIPQEKRLRQQIMASVRSKFLPEKQYRGIFKDTGGSRYLSNIGLPELEKVLSAVQRARPKKIGGRTVVTEKTEKAIQSLKTALSNQGKLNDDVYKDIMKYLRLKTDKFNNPQSFISEPKAKELIRQMNYEAEVGLIERDSKVAEALSRNPELKNAIGKIKTTLNVALERAKVKPVGISPLWDMHLYLEKLQERTGQRFADVWEEAIRTVYRNDALLVKMDEELARTVGKDIAKIALDEAALQRVNDAIASKHSVEGLAKIEPPTDITPTEQKIADHIEQELFGFQNKVRQTRFYTSYRENKGDVDAIARDIPNAPKKDIREAADIYESQGREALNTYLDTKDWGVIKSGYEPHNAVNYRLRVAPSKEAAVGKSHLRSREVSTAEQDRNILDRRRSYLRQAMNWDLEAYLREFDQMMIDVAPKLKNPNQVKNILEQAMRELKGYRPTDIMTRAVQRATSYAFSTLALSPAMTIRNALQNITMLPYREALLHLFDTKLDDTGQKYFDTFVSQQTSIVTDLLLQEGMGNTRLEQLVRRLTYYGWGETKINRAPGFLAIYGKALRALRQYKEDGKLSKFIKSSGIEELPSLEQKQVLEMLAQDSINFGVEGLESVPGEQASLYEIARRIVQQAHFNYKRVERAPIEMGASGRTWGSLMTFPRNMGQRIYQDTLRVKNGDKRQKWLAARRVIAILVFATFSDYLLRKVTGRERSEYNPLNIIAGWGLGGLAAGVGETVGGVIRNAVGVVTGEEGAINRLITAIPRAGDMFIPFYKSLMDLLEALSDTKFIDRKMLREVKQLLDENYKLRPDYYKQERNWIQKIQHALFSGEPTEQLGEIEISPPFKSPFRPAPSGTQRKSPFRPKVTP